MNSKKPKAIDEFVRANAGKMTQREIADKCKISVSTVNRKIRAMRAEEILVSKTAEQDPLRNKETDRDKDTLSRLVDLRDLLHLAVLEADGPTLARLSAEYRSVLKDIHDIKEADEDGDGSSKIADIFAELQNW